MKQHLLPIIITLLCIGCTPTNKDFVAVCGDSIVKIIDLSESDGKKHQGSVEVGQGRPEGQPAKRI